MAANDRFDVWVIVCDGRIVTRYLSEREARRYVALRNQQQGSPRFQSIAATAAVELVEPVEPPLAFKD